MSIELKILLSEIIVILFVGFVWWRVTKRQNEISDILNNALDAMAKIAKYDSDVLELCKKENELCEKENDLFKERFGLIKEEFDSVFEKIEELDKEYDARCNSLGTAVDLHTAEIRNSIKCLCDEFFDAKLADYLKKNHYICGIDCDGDTVEADLITIEIPEKSPNP